MSNIPGIASYELRPLSLAETLDAGFQLLKNHFVLLAALSAVAQIPTVIVFSAFDGLLDPFAIQNTGLPETGATFILGIGLYALGMLILVPIALGTLTSAVGDLYLGAELSVAACLRRGLARLLPLMVSYAIFWIVLLAGLGGVLLATFFAIGVGASALQGSALGVSLVVLLLLVGIPLVLACVGLLGLLPGVLAAVVVLEARSSFDALARTLGLVTSQLGRLSSLGLVLYLFVILASSGAQLLFGAIPVFGVVVWGLLQGVAQAYLYTTTVIAYFDVRCRLESFDLEHLARLVEGNAPRDEVVR